MTTATATLSRPKSPRELAEMKEAYYEAIQPMIRELGALDAFKERRTVVNGNGTFGALESVTPEWVAKIEAGYHALIKGIRESIFGPDVDPREGAREPAR